MKDVRGERCKVPEAFWRAVELQGLRAEAVLSAAGLPVMLRHDAAASISTAQLFAIWRAIELLSGDASFGIKMVRDTSTATHKLAFLAATYAENYRDGLARVIRFKRLCSPDKLHCDEKNGRVSITIEWPPGTEPEPDLSVDASFAMLIELGRRGTGQNLAPVAVEFKRAGPVMDLHGTYFDCPIRFGAAQNRFVLASADLDRPFIHHNPELLNMLAPALAQAMGELEAESTLVEQIKTVLKRIMPSGRPEIASVAREIGMSERTLQRRITAEGTTFRALIGDARQELGMQLLSDPALDIQEVAWLLGYQDTNSFYRAFREWADTTPGRWRQMKQRSANSRKHLG
ncbi:AraC family transcriptional regulator [Burkholderia sp. Bp9143]|uniref:AraC family transcriptional regulator n=1 Tax=Burkholderia sp. Bp9143 TaxID=2184574 RepID=UPI000F5B862E|nr:AraC family transcriptional regulator [Burkholderia sp. Bp9143]RQR34990.1 AraC family transcriptional regulator [Burkholderia sp. Bp9143]